MSTVETTAKLSPAQQAELFVAKCKQYGWEYHFRAEVVTITKRFAAGSNEGFTDCDMMASSVMEYVPARGGSSWGTDGGGIGGYSAIQNGVYRWNKSGVAKRFTKALAKITR